MRKIDLATAHWTIEPFGEMGAAPHHVRDGVFTAHVPGCVHSDLIRAGVVGHPNIGFNEESSQWIGRTDWRYRCQVHVDASLLLAHDRVDLVLDGLDTIAIVEVNGQRVGEAMNMHHAHRFDVKRHLRSGANVLTITLRGPITYVEEQERRLGKRPVNGDWTPYSYIRKMASNFQWDWGPKLATCGIWRGSRIEAWSDMRIAAVRPHAVRIANDRATVRVDVDVARSTAMRPVNIRGVLQHGDWRADFHCDPVADRSRCTAIVEIPEPELWWPSGYGGHALYDLSIVVECDGAELDRRSRRFGLRKATLIRADDSNGQSFAIAVNDVPVFCKGANWIPEGLFPEDQSPERLRRRVQQAADANMNMLRVWGGGTYEQESFYDACDELGILVWQDFMFACATYPEDDPYPNLIEQEAREAVSRLCSHPSIVLLCGGNENILGYESWGWKQRMPRDQKWGERYFLDILPHVVNEVDPSRSYWPDSPYSGLRDAHPNDPDRGDRHTWDAKVEEYRSIVPRFCSEFGHQSPPCWATLKEAWGEAELRFDARAMHHRQRATGGNNVWYGCQVMGGRFVEPADFDEWLYQAHLLQARAISLGIEWLRANQPRCMGALFWQFNDAWAGHSWSCIDSAGRTKPLWHAARRSFAPRLLTIQPMEGELRVVAINESMHVWQTDVHMRRMHMNGETLEECVKRIIVPPHAVVPMIGVKAMMGEPSDFHAEFLIAESVDGSGERAFWFFDHDRQLALPEPGIDASVARHEQEVQLTLQAHTLLRDVVLAVDRIDPAAEIDDNLITMLPGESRTLRIRTKSDAPAGRWIAWPVFNCANRHVRRA